MLQRWISLAGQRGGEVKASCSSPRRDAGTEKCFQRGVRLLPDFAGSKRLTRAISGQKSV